MLTGTQHDLELLRFYQGTANEHWALFIPNTSGGTKGEVLDAHYVHPGGTPFETRIYGERFNDITRYHTKTRTVIGHVVVPAQGAHAHPKDVMAAIKLKKNPPTQNCVDWANLAVDALFQQKYIDATTHTAMITLYNANQATVRAATAPALAALTDGGHEPGCRGCVVM